MSVLHPLVRGVDTAALLLLGIGIAVSWRLWRQVFRETDRKAAAVLVLLLAGNLLLLRPVVPRNVWSADRAVELLSSVTDAGRSPEPGRVADPTYALLLRPLRFLPGAESPVFTANYGIALASAFLLFLLVSVATGAGAPALLAAAILLFTPLRVRLSATESPFVLAEFLLLLTALLFCAAAKLRSPRAFLLGLLSLLALGGLRSEMLLLAPAAFAVCFLLLRGEVPAGALGGSRAAWGAGAAAALSVPRGMEALLGAGLPGLPGLHGVGVSDLLSPRRLNPFFDTTVTPLAFAILALLGLVLLWRAHRRAALALFFWALFFSGVYSFSCAEEALRWEASLAAQPALAVLAAAGFFLLTRPLGGRARWPLYALLLAFSAAAPLVQGRFLRKIHAEQVEFSTIQQAVRELPRSSVLAVLRDEDDAGARAGADYQVGLLEVALRRQGKTAVIVGIRRLLALSEGLGADGAFFFQGIACYKPQRLQAIHDELYIHPLCAAVSGSPGAAPVLEADAPHQTLIGEPIEGDMRTIGLYRVGKGLPAAGPAPAAWADAASWLRIGEAAWAAGQPGFSEAALRKAGDSGPDPATLRRLAALRIERGDLVRAQKAVESLEPGTGETAALWVALAEAAVRSGDAARARAALDRAETPAAGPDTLRRLANLHSRLAAPERSLRLLERLSAGRPGDGGFWLELAGTAKAAGKDGKALEALRRAGELLRGASPDQARRAAELGIGLGDHPGALAFLRRVGGPARVSDADLWLTLAEGAHRAGERAMAREAVLEARQVLATLLPGPEGEAAAARLRRAADLSYAMAEYGVSSEIYGLIQKRGGVDAAALRSEVVAALGAGRREAALAALGRMEQSGLQDARGADAGERARWMLRTYGEMGEFSRGSALIGRLKDASLDTSGLRLDLAEAALAAGRRDAALEILGGIEGGLAAGQYGRAAQAFLAAGDRGRAVRLLRQAAEGRPQDCSVWLELAAALDPVRDRQAVLDALEKARSLPAVPEQTLRLAIAFQDREAYPAALDLLDGLVAGSPRNARFRADRGVLKVRMGRARDAVKDLEDAIALDASLLPAYLTLGGALNSLGEPERALKVFDAGLALKPAAGDAPLREMLSAERRKASARTPR